MVTAINTDITRRPSRLGFHETKEHNKKETEKSALETGLDALKEIKEKIEPMNWKLGISAIVTAFLSSILTTMYVNPQLSKIQSSVNNLQNNLGTTNN